MGPCCRQMHQWSRMRWIPWQPCSAWVWTTLGTCSCRCRIPIQQPVPCWSTAGPSKMASWLLTWTWRRQWPCSSLCPRMQGLLTGGQASRPASLLLRLRLRSSLLGRRLLLLGPSLWSSQATWLAMMLMPALALQPVQNRILASSDPCPDTLVWHYSVWFFWHILWHSFWQDIIF